MTQEYRGWPGPARAMATAVDTAVAAARTGDATAFAEAGAQLDRVDAAQLAVLLGTVAGELLERAYPDGIDADDAERLLVDGDRAAAGLLPAFDRDVLLRALTGTLGVSLPDDQPPTGDVRGHGLVLIAVLLEAARADLPPLLDHALRELMREQTVELP